MTSFAGRAEEGPARDEEREPEKQQLVTKDGKPDVQAIIRHLDELYRSESSKARATLTVVKPRRKRVLKMRMWTKGTEHALIVIDSPARYKGAATLKVEKNLWNYDPKISRTFRIAPSMMLSSWMGSDFTNDDLVREASLIEDYDVGLVGPSEKPEGWRVRLKAREGVVGLWKRIEYVISPDGRLPLAARYYDRKGELARVMVFKDVRDFGGRKVPAHMVLTPVDRKGRRTEFVYEMIEFDADVPESTFSLSELERKR